LSTGKVSVGWSRVAVGDGDVADAEIGVLAGLGVTDAQLTSIDDENRSSSLIVAPTGNIFVWLVLFLVLAFRFEVSKIVVLNN